MHQYKVSIHPDNSRVQLKRNATLSIKIEQMLEYALIINNCLYGETRVHGGKQGGRENPRSLDQRATLKNEKKKKSGMSSKGNLSSLSSFDQSN